MATINGSCLCGSVRYTISGPITSMGHCHCKMCQHYHGTAYSTYAMVPRTAFKFTGGEQTLTVFRSSDPVERAFCGACGSPISYTHADTKDNIWLTAGSLDTEPDCLPQYHIFVADKVAWLEITDSLPQYPGFPPNH